MKLLRLALLSLLLALVFAVGFGGARPAFAATNFTVTASCTPGTPNELWVNITDITAGGTYTVNAAPQGGAPLTVTVTYIGFPAGGFLFSGADGTYTITVTRTSAPNESEQFSTTCPVPVPPTPVDRGPFIPSGFVLSTIICDVAVYDAPGGQPVPNSAITSGQTWYVNPEPVADAAELWWTEIFTAGALNGYVPTECVS